MGCCIAERIGVLRIRVGRLGSLAVFCGPAFIGLAGVFRPNIMQKRTVRGTLTE